MTMQQKRQDFFRKTREPVVGYMPAFVKRPGRRVEATSGTFTDSEGNINAHDEKELAQRINALSHIASAGHITTGTDATGEHAAIQRELCRCLPWAPGGWPTCEPRRVFQRGEAC